MFLLKYYFKSSHCPIICLKKIFLITTTFHIQSYLFSPTKITFPPGIKHYMCQICNYNGVTQSDLNRHLKTRTHLLRSRNVCPCCGTGFHTRSLSDEHFKSCHLSMGNQPGNPDTPKTQMPDPTATTKTTSASNRNRVTRLKQFRGPEDKFRGPEDNFRSPEDKFKGLEDNFRPSEDKYRGPEDNFRPAEDKFMSPEEKIKSEFYQKLCDLNNMGLTLGDFLQQNSTAGMEKWKAHTFRYVSSAWRFPKWFFKMFFYWRDYFNHVFCLFLYCYWLDLLLLVAFIFSRFIV